MNKIVRYTFIAFSLLIAASVKAQAPSVSIESPKIKGAWFATGLYSINIANNGHTYSKIGVMGGYLGNWGGYAKVAFDLVGSRTPNIVGGFTKRLTTFNSWNLMPSALYIYFGVGCGNVQHAGDHHNPDEIITLPDGSTQWVPSDEPSKTYWDGGTQAMFDIGLIYRYLHLNFNLGYSITPDFGFLSGGGADAPNHSIQIGIGYTF